MPSLSYHLYNTISILINFLKITRLNRLTWSQTIVCTVTWLWCQRNFVAAMLEEWKYNTFGRLLYSESIDSWVMPLFCLIVGSSKNKKKNLDLCFCLVMKGPPKSTDMWLDARRDFRVRNSGKGAMICLVGEAFLLLHCMHSLSHSLIASLAEIIQYWTESCASTWLVPAWWSCSCAWALWHNGYEARWWGNRFPMANTKSPITSKDSFLV